MTIISIDASTKASGYAVFTDGRLVESGVIKASSKDVIARIKKEASELLAIVNKYQPNKVHIEEILPEDVKHNQAVFKSLIYLQAALVLGLHSMNIDYELWVASSWRKLCKIKTGPGITRDRLKAAAMALVKTEFQKDVSDDEADAICIGIAALRKDNQKTQWTSSTFDFGQ